MKVLSVEAAVALIQDHEQHKGEQRFDVSLPSGDALVKKVTLSEFGIESFYASMDEHKTHELTLTFRNQQGASFKYGNSFTVSSKPTPPPLPMDKPATSGSSHYMDAYFQLMLTSKDEKLHEMQRSISLLENSLKSSEKEVYELKQKNMDLERENKLKNAEFELEKRNLEVERERDDFKKDSEGLNGLVGGVERLVANPAVV